MLQSVERSNLWGFTITANNAVTAGNSQRLMYRRFAIPLLSDLIFFS
jgi:hypothetical protein